MGSATSYTPENLSDSVALIEFQDDENQTPNPKTTNPLVLNPTPIAVITLLGTNISLLKTHLKMIFLFPLVGYVSIPVGFSYRKTQVMRICRAKSGDHRNPPWVPWVAGGKKHAIFGGQK